MRKRKLPFIVTSNVFLFFPMVASIYLKEWTFFIFTCFMFLASVGFHYTFYYNKKVFSLSRFIFGKKKYQSELFFRISDWSLASVGAFYVFHYIYVSTAVTELKLAFAGAFLSLLIFFLTTFAIGDYDKYHPWWHVFAPTLIGFIIILF